MREILAMVSTKKTLAMALTKRILAMVLTKRILAIVVVMFIALLMISFEILPVTAFLVSIILVACLLPREVLVIILFIALLMILCGIIPKDYLLILIPLGMSLSSKKILAVVLYIVLLIILYELSLYGIVPKELFLKFLIIPAIVILLCIFGWALLSCDCRCCSNARKIRELQRKIDEDRFKEM